MYCGPIEKVSFPRATSNQIVRKKIDVKTEMFLVGKIIFYYAVVIDRNKQNIDLNKIKIMIYKSGGF